MASERIPQGGGLTVYDPLVAFQGGLRDPAAYYNATLRKPLEGAGASAQQFLGKYTKYAPAAVGVASLIPGATTAISELEAGRPAGALGALVPGALSAVGTGLAMAPVPPMVKLAGYGLMGLGALLPGAAAQGVESAK